MKIMITGAGGQVGQELLVQWGHAPERFELYPFTRAELDITDMDAVQSCMNEIVPDVIVHAAAYTKVDQAETDSDTAFAVNAVGTRNVAVAAERVGAKLVYFSTDYVFDGKGQQSYHEWSSTSPQGIYGQSKWAGEQAVTTFCTRFFIVRTAWVYGPFGANFVKTMLKLASERSELTVVADQIGSPTYTADLVNTVEQLIHTERYGVYHVSGTGACSWYEFATEIFEQAGVKIRVTPCTTEEFPRPAPRPHYSVLEHLALRINGFEDLPAWQDGLRSFFARQSAHEEVKP